MLRRAELMTIAVGLVVLVAGALWVGDGTIPAWEESTFRWINDLPSWLEPVLWPGQILGALVIVPIVAVVALVLHQYWLALAVVIAGVVKLVSERIVKALVTRERPGTSIGPDINVRGDVSIAGESFVSGHAVLAATIATVVAPYVAERARVMLAALVLLVMFARVYVGAHNPLDVVCGAGLGIALGTLINIAVRVVRAERVHRPDV